MNIYDEAGQLMATVPDLAKGWLEDTQRLVQHHPAQTEKSHVEIMQGTHDLRRMVLDQPEQAVWDEYESVQIYHPYSPEELAEREKPTLEQRVEAAENALLEVMLRGGANV